MRNTIACLSPLYRRLRPLVAAVTLTLPAVGWVDGPSYADFVGETTFAKPLLADVSSSIRPMMEATVSIVAQDEDTRSAVGRFFYGLFGASYEPTYSTIGTSSGTLIDKERGLILTCAHCVAESGRILVGTHDDDQPYGTDVEQIEAELVVIDEELDAAILHVEPEAVATVREALLGSTQQLTIGSWVVAVGDAMGGLTKSVSMGILSGKDRTIDALDARRWKVMHYRHALQSDAVVVGGCSGGPLFTLDGKMVGILSAAMGGISFSAPIDRVMPLIEYAVAAHDEPLQLSMR